jgi:hypothetical protein
LARFAGSPETWPAASKFKDRNLLVEKTCMTRWFVPSLLAVSLMCGGSVAIGPAAAAPLQAAPQESQAAAATDLGARRHARHYRRYAYRPYYRPYYYDRPYYYRPYPYVAPAPFFLGFGFGPWW